MIHRSDAYPNLDYARVIVTFVEIIDNEAHPDNFEVRKLFELIAN